MMTDQQGEEKVIQDALLVVRHICTVYILFSWVRILSWA
jgi:hypothetical protein